MNEVLLKADVLDALRSFLDVASPNEEKIIIEIGCELLDVSEDKLLELLD